MFAHQIIKPHFYEAKSNNVGGFWHDSGYACQKPQKWKVERTAETRAKREEQKKAQKELLKVIVSMWKELGKKLEFYHGMLRFKKLLIVQTDSA